MARIKNGIMGSFSGAVGTVVGAKWRGIEYMRSRGVRRSATSVSQKQLDQRNKMAMASSFAYSMKKLLDLTFKQFAIGKTGTNCAVSHILTHAVSGNSSHFELDYSRVLISNGELPGVLTPTVSSFAADTIHFTWIDNTQQEGAQRNDRAITVAYCPALNKTIYSTIGADRKTGTYTLEVHPFRGYEVHTYISFISEDSEVAAKSTYTGIITIG